jgi:hypothetical protein
VLHVVLLNTVFFGYARYRQPVEPLCILIAWGGVAGFLAARRVRAAAGSQSASGGGAIGS